MNGWTIPVGAKTGEKVYVNAVKSALHENNWSSIRIRDSALLRRVEMGVCVALEFPDAISILPIERVV